jgi:cytochrome c-type biogenesis protein CcmH/NrfG
MGEGQELIARAVVADAAYPDAHFFLGFVRREDGDLEGALTEWDAYLALDPPAGAAQAVREAADEVRVELGLPVEPVGAGAATTAP